MLKEPQIHQSEQEVLNMYGCDKASLSYFFEVSDDYFDLQGSAMSILSDSQEALRLGDSEKSRQLMNKAKFLMGHVKRELRKQGI